MERRYEEIIGYGIISICVVRIIGDGNGDDDYQGVAGGMVS